MAANILSIKDSDVINVVLNGNQLEYEQNPVNLSDRVLAPIRAIAEGMGAEVSWDYSKRAG